MLYLDGTLIRTKELFRHIRTGEVMVLKYDNSTDDFISVIEKANRDEIICLQRSLGIEDDLRHDAGRTIYNMLSKEASNSIGRLVRPGKGLPYWLVVHNTAKYLKAKYHDKDASWAQKNYPILERNIFDMMFRTFLYSIPDDKREKLDESLSIVGDKLLRNSDKNDSRIATISSLGLGSTSLLAIIGSSIGSTIAPLWLLALGALTAQRFGSSKYKRLVPAIAITASIRIRLESVSSRDNDYDLYQGQILVRSGF